MIKKLRSLGDFLASCIAVSVVIAWCTSFIAASYGVAIWTTKWLSSLM